MTAEAFIASYRNRVLPPGYRLGQAAFNMLMAEKPEMAESIRATGLDPFHCRDDGDRMARFEAYLREQWEAFS